MSQACLLQGVDDVEEHVVVHGVGVVEVVGPHGAGTTGQKWYQHPLKRMGVEGPPLPFVGPGQYSQRDPGATLKDGLNGGEGGGQHNNLQRMGVETGTYPTVLRLLPRRPRSR